MVNMMKYARRGFYTDLRSCLTSTIVLKVVNVYFTKTSGSLFVSLPESKDFSIVSHNFA